MTKQKKIDLTAVVEKPEGKPAKHAGGRPTAYTKELGERICNALENSPRGIRFICENTPGFPEDQTIRAWLRVNKFPEFTVNYARARQAQADYLADEIVDVAYNSKADLSGRVEQPKLLIDTLKWRAGKLKPKVYGDKPELFIDPKADEATKVDGATIAERLTKIDDLIAKKIRINGE